MKKVAYGFAGLIVLLVAAALIVPSLIDWNAYKPEIAAEARKATGRTLDISGDLRLGILPTPHLSLSDATFSNVPGATAKHMATLKELRASVKLLPLLSGKIEIASVELIAPVIELEKMPDGSGNWAFAPPAAPETTKVQKPPAGPAVPRIEKPNTDTEAFSLGLLRIKDGTIVYRDKAAGTVERIEKLSIDLSAQSLAGPFTANGVLTIRDIALKIDARVGRFAEKGTLPFDIALGTPNTKARIGLKGTVTDLETTPSVTAKLDGEGDDLGGMIASLSGSTAPPALSQPFSISASVKGSEEAVSAADLSLGLGKSRLSGEIGVTLRGGIRANISLRATTLNIDEYLATATKAAPRAPPAPAKPSIAGGTKKPAEAPAPAKTAGLVLPRDIQAGVDIRIDEAIARKGRIRDFRLAAGLKDGVVTLNTLTARLPGNAAFTASGKLTAADGKMSYGGRTSFETDSLRTLLDWLQVDVASVPADRLRRFSLKADVSGNPDQVQIANIAGQLDASRMNGGVTVALRDRPAFGARVSIDQFNADAYRGGLADAKPSGEEGRSKPSSGSPAATGKEKPSKQKPPGKGPLAALNDFDANLALRVGTLNYQGTTIQGIRLDGTLVNGVLTLRDAGVRNLAGTSAQVVGTLTGLDGVPAFKGTIAAASNDLSGLFRIAGVEPPISPRKLGKMRLTSKTEGSVEGLKINADIQIAEIRAKVSGSLSGLESKPEFDLAFDGKHPELARLANLFSTGKPGPRAGPVDLKMTLKGGIGAVTIATNARVAGGTFRVSGKVDKPVEAPALDLSIDLKHPDMVRLVQAFSPDFRPSRRQLGGLSLAAKLQGTGQDMTISDLAGNIGPTKVAGSGSYVGKSPRPALKLALTSSVIPLSDFLEAPGAEARPVAPGSGAGGQAAASPSPSVAPGGGRWSTEPFDTSMLGLVDAEIDIGAEALLYLSYRVDKPRIVAILKDRVLDVRHLTGLVFSGTFDMEAQLDGRKTPAVKATMKIRDAKVDNAFFQGDSFDIEAGNLSHDLAITTKGNSQDAMLRALNGNGSLSVSDGVVRGFDLLKLNRALKGLDIRNLALALPAAAAAIGPDKTTRLSSLKGTFKIVNGVVTTKDAALVSDGGSVSAAGSVNLPAWDMNMLADIRPRKVEEVPLLRLTLTGPPDQPNTRFNFEELTAGAITQGVGNILKTVLPGMKKNDDTEPQQPGEEQKQESKPTDVLKDLLRGLGR